MVGSTKKSAETMFVTQFLQERVPGLGGRLTLSSQGKPPYSH